MSFTENTASPVHVMKTEKNSPTMIHRNLTAELAVVGGGLAGVCAAIAAARHGVKTVLIQDRPVLGGNASSEIRMGIVGAHGDENKETGILEELQLENIRRNPLMRYTRWDDILYSAVIREPNLKLLLNTSVRKTETNGKRIVAVEAWNGNEYCEYRISADFFADCSGDGILRLSGAEFRIGRELPGEDYFEDFTQLDNGVGMLRLLRQEFCRGLNLMEPEEMEGTTPFSIATGVSAAPFLTELIDLAREKCGKIEGAVYPIRNDFFGETITVAGLVTGGDLIAQLRGKPLGERLLIPQNMLRHGERVFLDDVSLDDVERELGVPVTPVAQDGYELLDAMCGLEVPPMEQVQLREETEYFQYNPGAR